MQIIDPDATDVCSLSVHSDDLTLEPNLKEIIKFIKGLELSGHEAQICFERQTISFFWESELLQHRKLSFFLGKIKYIDLKFDKAKKMILTLLSKNWEKLEQELGGFITTIKNFQAEIQKAQ